MKENWWLFALLGVCLAGAVVFALRDGGDTPETADTGVAPGAGQTRGAATPPPARAESDDRARQTIEEHLATIEADPDAPEVPALHVAIANLYRQKLMTYSLAAEHYAIVLRDYPEWDGIRAVYTNLAHCYERLGEEQEARDVYGRMLSAFPEGSQEHNLAYSKLFGELPDSVTAEPAPDAPLPPVPVPADVLPQPGSNTPESAPDGAPDAANTDEPGAVTPVEEATEDDAPGGDAGPDATAQ